MKQRKFTLPILILGTLLWLASCGGSGKSAAVSSDGDTLALRHAANLTLVQYEGYMVASLRNPWDTLKTLHTYVLWPDSLPEPAHLPMGTLLRVPLKRAVVYSSVHCSLLQQLGAATSIGGVCDLKYIKLPAVQQGVAEGRITDCGDGMNPDMERIIDLHPDAILLSPFENSGGYGRIEKLEVPIMECADYMETSPLGRAEWMRFYGRLFGVAAEVDSLFGEVEQRYQALQTQAMQTATRPTLLSELKNGSAWYVPGGRSTMGILYRDAGARYLFADDPHSGSVPLAFEAVFEHAAEADVWLVKYHRPQAMTYAEMERDYAGYRAFKAFKERKVYGCNTGSRPFYEEAPFRPDYLLHDLLQIFHPEIADADTLRYFCPLKER